MANLSHMEILRTATAVSRRLVHFSRERGLLAVAYSCLRWGVDWVRGLPRAGKPARTTFAWDGAQVRYFNHRYNYTWLNERAVETALALEVLAEHRGQDILEIGNVLGHYVRVEHLVVDKYEVTPGVVNCDVAELRLDERFDLVLAVSTLEHVGVDEDTKDPGKAARSVERLKGLLKPGGLLWITVPVDYNTDLDRQVRDGELDFTRLRALRRDDHRNRWREVPVADVWDAAYDRLLYTAHGLVVAEFVAPTGPA